MGQDNRTGGHIKTPGPETGQHQTTTGRADHQAPPIEEGSNPLGHTLTECDHKLRSVYRDRVHCNDGKHLTGGFTDDALWHTQWRRVRNLTPSLHDTLKGKAGRRFVTLLTEELKGAQ